MRKIALRGMFQIVCLLAVVFFGGCGGDSSDSLNLTFMGTVENLQLGAGRSSPAAAAGVQVCALGGCDVTNANGQFSFKVDGDQFTGGDALFQFSKQDWNADLVVENIPAGPGVVSFKFKLHDNTVFGGLSAFDQSCATDNLGEFRGCGICSYTLMIDFVVEDYWETGEARCGNCGSYIRSKTWVDSQGVLHDQVEEWEYVYREGYGAGDEDQPIDPAAAPGGGRGVEYIISRRSGNRLANFVQVTAESGGGVFGHALYLSIGGQLVFSKFVPFEEAITRGNEFIAAGTRPLVESTPSVPTTESADPTGGGRPIVTYEKGNVKTWVSKTTMESYSVGVSVDNQFVITVYKDCNSCPYFYFPTAEERARTYLELLQGWKHN